MKKKFFKLGAIALTMSSAALNVNAQVGINTESPKTTLDIVQRDTATVKGKGFRLVDGHQNKGFVLTSDSTGVGTWEASGVSQVLGYFPPAESDQIAVPLTSTGWIATKAYIDLPPGMWRIDMLLFVDAHLAKIANSTDKYWLIAAFSSDISAGNLSTFDHQTSTELGMNDTQLSYRLISNYVHRDRNYSEIQGTIVVRNQSTLTKRYYLIIRNPWTTETVPSSETLYVTGAFFSENTIIAIPIMSIN